MCRMNRVVLAYLTLAALSVPGALIIDALELRGLAMIPVVLPIMLAASLIAPQHFGWVSTRHSRGKRSPSA